MFIVVSILVGCSSVPSQKYTLENKVQIIAMEEEKVLELSKRLLGKEKKGMFVTANPNRVYVPYSYQKDKKGNYLPDF